MFDSTATALGSTIPTADPGRLYPDAPTERADIHDLNDLIYTTINNGAYKAGFSFDQGIYRAAFDAYFDTPTQLDDLLSDGRAFLTGANFTEADLRLFPTLYRHNPVYYVRMKLNGARILDTHTFGAGCVASMHCQASQMQDHWCTIVNANLDAAGMAASQQGPSNR